MVLYSIVYSDKASSHFDLLLLLSTAFNCHCFCSIHTVIPKIMIIIGIIPISTVSGIGWRGPRGVGTEES